MPPKQAASKKADQKAKAKSVEDKTFGLKNKNKSKKVEAYIKSVTSQANNRPADRKAEAMAQQRKEEKALQEAAKKEMDLLFKPVIQQTKVPVGVDPKSILCEYFKQGQCTKGAKCKYSHDLNINRKVEKIDIYTDQRGTEENTMEDWDDAKLKQAVGEKQTATNRNLQTKIICKHFLEAIENQKYGWFWECPNGGDACMYVHALPPGFVLKKKKKDEDEEEEEPISLEEQIEEQRRQLVGGTAVTLETFMKWKEDKKRQKEEKERAAEEKRQADIKAGRTQMSGREMFVFNPEMFVDDDEAADDDDYERETEIVAPDMEEPTTEYLGNDNDESSTSTTTTSTSAAVDSSLFAGGDDDIPDDA